MEAGDDFPMKAGADGAASEIQESVTPAASAETNTQPSGAVQHLQVQLRHAEWHRCDAEKRLRREKIITDGVTSARQIAVSRAGQQQQVVGSTLPPIAEGETPAPAGTEEVAAEIDAVVEEVRNGRVEEVPWAVAPCGGRCNISTKFMPMFLVYGYLTPTVGVMGKQILTSPGNFFKIILTISSFRSFRWFK